MATPSRILSLIAVLGLVASACSDGSSESTTTGIDPSSAAPAQVTDQLSLEPAAEGAGANGGAEPNDTVGADTSNGEENDDGSGDADDDAGTDGDTDSDGGGDEAESALDTPLEPVCEEEPTGRWQVNVRLDDSDGGLHLRTGAGTVNDIILPLPTGTEVAALGGCEVTDTGREWFELEVVTDPDLVGWAAADWLVPLERTTCSAGSLDTSGLVGIRTAEGDFDGDRRLDVLTIGNHEEGEVAVVQVEFADGGFVRGDADIRAGEILTPFRPIGAVNDIALVFDGLTSGAATASHVGVEVRNCEVYVFEGVFENGGVTGNSSWCLEDTSVGVRIWSWDAPLTDDPADPLQVTWEARMYNNGGLVRTPALDFEDRWCVPPAALGTVPGSPLNETSLVGLEATDPWNLAFLMADRLGAGTDADVVRGIIDPGAGGTGTATFDIVGLQGGDVIVGYRLDFTWAPGTNGIAATAVTSTAMCGRGTDDNGLCL